jgi:hypothetical protein
MWTISEERQVCRWRSQRPHPDSQCDYRHDRFLPLDLGNLGNLGKLGHREPPTNSDVPDAGRGWDCC